jgi:hypothetical protein
VQLHRPALVLMDLRLPGEMDGLAAGHAIQAIDDVRVIYFMGETSAQLTEHTEPPVRWTYDGEPMNLEALHRILVRTMESGHRPLRPPVPMGREQSATIWRVPRILLGGLNRCLSTHARHTSGSSSFGGGQRGRAGPPASWAMRRCAGRQRPNSRPPGWR